jgi:hypothetical protein
MEQALLGSMLGRSQFPVSVIRDNWLKDLRIDRSFIRQPGPGGQEIEVGELLMSVEYLASQVRQHAPACASINMRQQVF